MIVVDLKVVSRSQTFRLTAEGLEYMAAFIGQGPPIQRSIYSDKRSPSHL